MEDLNALALFVEVAQSGSYTEASKQLKVPISTVSRKVSQLETRLGVQLFQRTTRSVALTEIGQIYLRHCQEMVDKALEAEQAVMSLQSEPSGHLRFGIPYFAGRSFTSLLFNVFLQRYPKINMECIVLPNQTEPTANNLDCMISFGVPNNLDLLSRSLGSLNLMLCASPDYLKRDGEPRSIFQLATEHSLILLAGLEWEQWGVANFQTQEFNYRFSINDMEATRQMVVDGAGIGFFPMEPSDPILESGRLINIMPECNNPLPMQVCFPANRHISRKLRVFVDHLVEVFQDTAPWLNSAEFSKKT
ncbi:MAG: LysR family transcriptional regulator [Pseudomonadales bacterium]|nr:LysR family transcriptional regulator [Pseudomonadales bacterium]